MLGRWRPHCKPPVEGGPSRAKTFFPPPRGFIHWLRGWGRWRNREFSSLFRDFCPGTLTRSNRAREIRWTSRGNNRRHCCHCRRSLRPGIPRRGPGACSLPGSVTRRKSRHPFPPKPPATRHDPPVDRILAGVFPGKPSFLRTRGDVGTSGRKQLRGTGKPPSLRGGFDSPRHDGCRGPQPSRQPPEQRVRGL